MKLDLPLGTAAVGLLGLLHRLRDQGADVPVPHLAARRARRGADRRLGDSGQRAAEDGDVRIPAFLAAAAAASLDRPHDRAGAGGAVDHRHHLRRAGQPDAAGLEEAGRVLLGEPPGLLHAGHFRAESERHRRQRAPADQSRHLDRHALPDHRRDLRAAPHARDRRVRRPGARHAEVRHRLRVRHAQFGGPAAAERVHRRVHHPARRVRGEPGVGGVRGQRA